MRLPADKIEMIRTKPQQTRLNLIIYKPNEIYSAKVASPSITKGAITIPFDSASPTGSIPNIYSGQTLLVGSEPSADDYGRIRLRSSTANGGFSGSFTVGENSNIMWQDGQYLTVLDYIEINPIYPRIIQNPNDATKVIFYKDYNIPYVNQNRYLGSILNMGSHRARVLKNGQAQIFWSATGTHTLDVSGTISNYVWAFGGGTPTGSTLETPGLVTYSQAGDYVTSLTVYTTGSYNTSNTGYRYVAVRDAIGQGTHTPFIRWEMSDLSGSRSEGGYSAKFTVYDNIDDIKGNLLVMLVSDDWYASTHESIGGNTYNEPDVFFVGYIEQDSIKYDYKKSQVEFTATSVTGIMKNALGFSVSVESKKTPSTWYELYNMDCKRAVYHYLRWHSTILSITDFTFNGTDSPIQYYDADRTSMFDSVDELMRSALVGSVCADRQGRLYAEVEPRGYDDPTGSFGNYVMDITRRDWISEPNIDEQVNNQVSYMERGGVRYKGDDLSTFQALLSCAPGVTPSFRGGLDKEQGLALRGQTQLNALIGHLYANRNSRFPNINMDMSENTANLDIAPFESVNINILKEDTVRNRHIQGLYYPESISWRYDHKDGVLLPSIDFKSIVNGYPGDTIIIPPADDGNMNFPPIDFTPLAIPPMVLPPMEFPGEDASTVVIVSDTHGVLYTTNFDENAPKWQTMNEGLAPGTYTSIGEIVKTASGALFIMCDGNKENGYGSIYYTPGVGEPWTLVAAGGGSDNYHALGVNPDVEEIAVLGGLDYVHPVPGGQGIFYVGDSYGLTPGTTNMNMKGKYQHTVKWFGGSWRLLSNSIAGFVGNDYQTYYALFDANGGRTSEYWSTTIPAVPNWGWTRWAGTIAKSTGELYAWPDDSTATMKIVDLDFTQFNPNVFVSPPGTNYFQAMCVAPMGQRLMRSAYDGTFYLTYKSTDGGNSWNLEPLAPTMLYCYENCDDENRWILGGGGGIAGGVQVKYTSNFLSGGSNENKEGNLHPDFTGLHLTHIKFIK